MKEKALKDIVSMICNDYIDTILVGIEEYKKDFPYTIACSNFIAELKEKNVVVEFNDIFISKIIDKLYREISNYLAR